ncbi:hypothetical protein GCM10009430_25440 [Aquimarina litoralis]|uniref:VWA domain-containing protein n=1 Tax=Aquimarina litoralis TaxID=584605 RepID=A0ABN1IWC1_9FLAO
MQIHSIGLIIAAGIIALIISIFQYTYKAKNRTKKHLFFALLRFLSVFTLLILLINPTFRKKSSYIEKPSLIIAVDNSSSIKHLSQNKQVIELVDKFQNSEELQDRFNVKFYTFSDRLEDTLNLKFDKKQTNISNALGNLDQIYKNSNAPTVLITDGNQTYGGDYQFSSRTYKQQVFPVIAGDTIKVADTKIQQLNVNRYSYLKNRFPVEVILTYSGVDNVSTKFEIKSGKNTIYSQPVSFSKDNNSEIITLTLGASKAGVLQYTARLVPLENEKNVINNNKDFAVEVIDQKTNILLVSDMTHPDLGAIKKSVESNERRSITILKPAEVQDIEDYQLIILYQPNTRFSSVYKKITDVKKNHFTITGSKTDWVFLNKVQDLYKQEITRQTEYYLPRFNNNYGTFLLEDIGFGGYPPLVGTFGEIAINSSYDVILHRNISNINTEEPLLATVEDNGTREAVLFGEGIWRWRAQSYLDTKSFETFDEFFSKLVQYLASNKKKSRLNTIAESFYYGNSSIKIKAEYFTRNYEFDNRGNLSISLKNKDTEQSQTIPMLLKNNSYEVDLSSLSSGNYDYTVSVIGENISRSGSFSILDYNVEQQLLNADVTKLTQVATNTNGKAYFMNQDDILIQDLVADERYKAVQKSKENIVSLIDWKYLLAILIALLSIEWFMRKYNGLI